MPDTAALDVRGLEVRYGDVVAVDGLSLWAGAGEVLAILGPNGAGKTSTVETIEGYRRPAAGEVRVLGLDPWRDRAALAPRIGVMLQRGGVYPTMTARQALALFAAYYDDPVAPGELLARVGLDDGRVAATPWRRLSGGEQQRVALALALVGRPSVVFLDEPTAGVDPAARQLVRQVVRDLRDEGACVVLTTHELEEAERLADRVAILDRGRLVALGSVAELTAGGDAAQGIRFGAPPGLDVAGLGARLGAPVVEAQPGEYVVDAPAAPATVAALTAWLAERDLPLADLRAARHRLEDVYLRVTARGAAAASPELSPVEHAERAQPAKVRPARRARAGRAGRRWQPLLAQTKAEVAMTLRRGESVLLTLGIPVLLLAFFSTVDVLPIDAADPVDFLAPGVLSLAVMSTSMVGLGIATGFERQYLVLKRLGTTPLGRPALLAAKTASVLAVQALQVAVLVPLAYALGWRPSGGVVAALGAVCLGTVAFAGLGLLMAGTMRAEAVLAGANGLYLVLLLLGGMVVPLAELPSALRAVARALPAASLSDLLHGAFAAAAGVPGRAWLVLAAWAVAAPLAAARVFRWE